MDLHLLSSLREGQSCGCCGLLQPSEISMTSLIRTWSAITCACVLIYHVLYRAANM